MNIPNPPTRANPAHQGRGDPKGVLPGERGGEAGIA